MKSSLLSHRGYHGSIEPCVLDGALKGHVLFIDELITYTALTIPALQQTFTATIDNYLARCASDGKLPQRPFKGQFNVRIAPQLHQTAVLRAETEGTSLNNIVVKALSTYLMASAANDSVDQPEDAIRDMSARDGPSQMNNPSQPTPTGTGNGSDSLSAA